MIVGSWFPDGQLPAIGSWPTSKKRSQTRTHTTRGPRRPDRARAGGTCFCHRPPVPIERSGTVRVTETARADAINGAQCGAAMFEGLKIWVRAPDSSEGERAKREQYSRSMPELKAPLQTERLGLREVGSDLVAPRCKERSGSGSFGSEPTDRESFGFVRQESEDELRGIAETLVGVVYGLLAGMAGPKEALSNGCGLKPVRTCRNHGSLRR